MNYWRFLLILIASIFSVGFIKQQATPPSSATIYSDDEIDRTIDDRCSINGIVAPIGSCEAEDGLILLGDFDRQKQSIIFVHGWIPEYEMGVPDFPNAQSWSKQGFNTFIFRYVNKASDPGDGSICDVAGFSRIGTRTLINCPQQAEPRVWALDGSGADLVTAYQEFFDRFPLYDREIRLVGHSLGAQIATYAAYKLNTEYAGIKPKRVELIDPFIGTALINTGHLPPGAYTVEKTKDRPQSKCRAANRQTVYCVMEDSLLVLQEEHDVAIAVFGSIAAEFFAADFKKFFHYQAFNRRWLCGEVYQTDVPLCKFKNLSLFTAQHFFPLLAYFWSIDEIPPQGGYSALTPSAVYRQPNRLLYQKAKTNYCNLASGTIFWKKGGLDHVFGVARYPDRTIGEGYQQLASSKAELARRLQTRLNFSESEAQQCVKAISLANDYYFSLELP